MAIWQTIIAAILGNAAALAVLGWLGKSILEKLLQRDSKRFELDLKSKADTAIEQFKSDLQLRTIEHQIRFAKLHEKRASVIADLNGHLAEVLWEAENVLSPIRWQGEPTEREKYQAAMTKSVEFFRYFDKHKIYLPAELCSSIDQLVREVRAHILGFGVYLTWEDDALLEHTRKEKSDVLLEGWKLLKEKVPAVRGKLEDEFRLLLGPSA